MSSTYYQIYLQQIFRLVETIVVKSEITINAINKELVLLGNSVDYTIPQTWKYYMNLAGEYHSTDVPMSIVSLDTLNEISFTKANLDVHRATKEAYAYGTRYYNDLVMKYPDQEQLILGILNPIKMSTAIAAEDGAILYYDKTLVETQEHSLISDLQDWINAYITRWSNDAYNITDEYYAAAFLGIMYTNMPLEIINLRIARCHTPEAHSYHIRQYLGEHYGLDKYMNVLSLKQALFLYRNIRYIHRNAGTQKNFESIMEKLMTDRFLPLAEYSMRHDTSTIIDTMYPDVFFKRDSLNNISGDGSSDIRTTLALMSDQAGLAEYNDVDVAARAAVVDSIMKHSTINELSTKVLESALLDTTDCVPYRLEEITYNHWIYLASLDRYITNIQITEPSSNKTINLSAKEAFIMYLYAINAGMGVRLDAANGGALISITDLNKLDYVGYFVLDNGSYVELTDLTVSAYVGTDQIIYLPIPLIPARRVKKTTLPTVGELQQFVDQTIVSDELLLETLEKQPVIGTYISVSAFKTFCRELYVAMNYQYKVYSTQDDAFARAMLQNASRYCYMDKYVDLFAGEVYHQWLASRGIVVETYTVDNYNTLAANIVDAIGIIRADDESKLKETQTSMLAIMRELSSYSVQYIQSINDGSYNITDIVYPRLMIKSSETAHSSSIPIGRIRPYSVASSSETNRFIEFMAATIYSIDPGTIDSAYDIPLDIDYAIASSNIRHMKLPIGAINLTIQ